MTRNLVGIPTGTAHRLRLLLIPLVCIGLAWVGTANANSEDPPPQEGSETPNPPDSGATSKGGLESVVSDDQDDNKDGDGGRLHWGPLYPSITVVSSGASVGPELQLWLPNLGASPLDFHVGGIYSIRHYQHYTAQFGLLPERRHGPPSFATSSTSIYPLAPIERLAGAENHFVLYGSYRYRDYPEEDFYGVGFDTPREDHTNFGLRDHLFEAVTGYHFSPRFAVTVRAGLLETSLGLGKDSALAQLSTRFDSLTAPGFGDPPEHVILTTGAIADLRDQLNNPHKGALFMVGLSRFEDRHGGPFEFTRAAGDARFYVPLFTPKHVIAARALVSSDWPDAGSRVPFYLQSMLGGSRLLRGYPSFRFRDDALTAFSVEYRFEPISKLELALFYDAGQVAESFSALDLADLKTAWGGGIRIKSKHRMLLRFDVARSRETTRYLVKTSPAF
jgi:surface antigen Omp85-like protein